MRRWTILLALLLPSLFASPALADEQIASNGAVTATFSFESGDEYGYSDLRLRIERDAQLLYDDAVSAEGCEEPSCQPGAVDRDSVSVADLDADGEPEVVVTLYWGGAHCCTIALVLAFDGAGYRVVEHNFGNPSIRLADLDHDGTTEFLTADDRFAYRYTSYASSVLPVRVMAWDGRRLVDETQAHKDRVRADLGRTWRLMRSSSRRGYEPRGAAAAWAANRYRLGKRQSTLRTLRRLARTDRLPGFPTRDPLRFVSALDRFLVRSGFAP
jgi:hypothetical protein